MRRFDSCIFCAILRRRPTILMSFVASLTLVVVTADAAGLRRAPPRARYASRSAWTMRPAVPVAATSPRSMPSSHARARTAGEAIGRDADGNRDAGVAGCVGAAGCAGAELGPGAGEGPALAVGSAGADAGADVVAVVDFTDAAPAPSSTSIRIS